MTSAPARVIQDARRNRCRLTFLAFNQSQVRTSEGSDVIPRVRFYMPARACLRLCLLITAATASGLPVPATADPRRGIVVIMPPARLQGPPPPASEAPPPKLWLPPAALGPVPGAPSPAPRCYAGTSVCSLARPEQVGQACTCTTPPWGPTTGRALIPPSHDITGHPVRTGQ